MKPTYFATAQDFRKWLVKNHGSAGELWVGFYRKSTDKRSITWPESVDEALCFGWIDGIRKSHDADSYVIRFTPRKPSSIWSAVNIRRAEALIAEGRMQPAGQAAFNRRRENKSGIYSYEQRPEQLIEPYLGMLKKNRSAWAFFQAQPASYRRAANWWVISAKKEATRLQRLQTLITDSAEGRTIPPFTRKPSVVRRKQVD